MRRIASILAALALSLAARAGDNIDVSTIPPRDGVQLTIYNSVDLTLVRETRTITFARGDNGLQFSWHGTLIDPTSVEIRFLERGDGLDVLETTYPHDRPQTLNWTVRSTRETAATVEITYFTSGISWAADYVITAAPDEATLAFDGFVYIMNDSGEDYDDASVRLVVGEINLVEQIEDLATTEIAEQLEDLRSNWDDETAAVAFQALRKAEGRGGGMGGGGGGGMFGAPEIVKEGLSEYFIFTVEGRQDVPHEFSRRLALFDTATVPNRVVYRFRPAEYGPQLVRLYTFKNDEASELGTSPLPDGIVRVFRRRDDGLTLLSDFVTDYIPIGQDVDVVLGPDPEVVYEQRTVRTWRNEFWFRDRNGRRLIGPDDNERVTDEATVVGWTENGRLVDRIRNGHPVPISVELRRTIGGDSTLNAGPAAVTRFDVRTAQFDFRVAPSTAFDLPFSIATRQGENARQDRLLIEGLD